MDQNDNNRSLQSNELKQPIIGMVVRDGYQPMTSPPSSTEYNVPSRFKEGSFRRFEQVLQTYVTQYPEALFVKPQGLSLETFSCRLRDAVKALRRNRHWNLSLSDQLESVWPDTVVAYHDGQVRIGRRTAKSLKGSFEVVQNALTSSVNATNELVLPFTPVIGYRVCSLLEILDGQVQIRFNKLQLNNFLLQPILLQHPNVEAFQDGEDVVLL